MSTGTNSPNAVSSLPARLEPVLSGKYALTWKHAVIAGWFAVTFLLINHLPLSLHKTWRHASQGRWILTEHQLPTAMPHAELADGMPFLATSWLSDVLIAWLADTDPELVSAIMASVSTLGIALWCWLYYQASGRKRFALALAFALTVYWSFGFGALRAQALAGVALPMTFCLLWPFLPGHETADVPQLNTWRVAAFTVLFVLWANLDISHLLGVLILASVTVGVAWNHIAAGRRGRELISHVAFQRWVLLTELAILATLLTPHGFDLWLSLLSFDVQGPIWGVAGGSYGISLATTSGALFGVLVLSLALLWSRARHPVPATEIITAVALMIVTAMNVSCVYWCAPVLLLYMAWHLRGAGTAVVPAPEKEPAGAAAESQPLKFGWSLLCLLLIWFGFAFSPAADPLLAGKPRSASRLYDEAIPRGVGEFSRERGLGGLLWAPADWSDWLAWNGPADARLFVNSQLGSFPALVQRDYWLVFRGDANWQLVADRYGVDTLVVDKRRQSRLAAEIMRAGGDWQLVYESPSAMVAHRTTATTTEDQAKRSTSAGNKATAPGGTT